MKRGKKVSRLLATSSKFLVTNAQIFGRIGDQSAAMSDPEKENSVGQ